MKAGGSAVAMIAFGANDRHQLVLGDPQRSEFRIPYADGSSSTVRLVSADPGARTATIDVDGLQMELRIEQRGRANDDGAGK
jgi:hypothetical protein